MTIQSTGKSVRASGLRLDYLTRPQLFAAGGAAVVAIAAFLPWSTAFGLGVSGIQAQGRVTLLCAVLALAVTAFSTDVIGRRTLTRQAYLMGSAPAAAVVGVTALRAMNDHTGVGIYVTLGAVAVWAASLVWDVNEHTRRFPPG